MLAVKLYEARDLRVEDIPIPVPEKNWVLVKTLAVGICGTDKAFYVGTYPLFKKPLIPGHEVCGEVVEGPQNLVGKRVVPEINFACFSCSICREGLYTHCPYKKTLGIDFDGGMAEYFVAPINVLHIVDDLDPVIAVEVEPLAAVINALGEYTPKPIHKIAVVGTGNLAYLTTQLLKSMGFRDIAVVARSDSPKKKFFENLNVDIVDIDSVDDYIARKTRYGIGFDMVFEVTGSRDGLDLAIKITRPRGIVHIKSTPGIRIEINSTLAVVKELKLICTRCGNFNHFEKAIELLKNQVIKPLITSIESLSNAKQAFEKALSRDQLKVVLKP